MKEDRVVYPIPTDVAVERTADLTYQVCEDRPLKLDLYRPANAPGVPVVVFVHGDSADPEVVKDIKDWGQYVSWGELIASVGLAAVTFNHRSAHGGTRMQDVMDDIGAALAFIEERADGLGIDRSRLAIFGISMGVPYGVCAASERDPKPRCAVAYYGPLDWGNAPLPAPVSATAVRAFSPLYRLEGGDEFPPLLIVRAGQDHIPLLNASIDTFVAAALSKNLEVDLINHAEGPHAFDVRDGSRRSQAVIASTLEFLQRRLLEE